MSYAMGQGVDEGLMASRGAKLLEEQNLSETRIMSLKLRNKLNYAMGQGIDEGY